MTPCFKRHVVAILVTESNETYHGVNWIENDEVKECPRTEGEGYEKCKDVCRQKFHAERAAVNNCIMAGGNPMGATLYLSGHYRCCDDCQRFCDKWGIDIVIKGEK